MALVAWRRSCRQPPAAQRPAARGLCQGCCWQLPPSWRAQQGRSRPQTCCSLQPPARPRHTRPPRGLGAGWRRRPGRPQRTTDGAPPSAGGPAAARTHGPSSNERLVATCVMCAWMPDHALGRPPSGGRTAKARSERGVAVLQGCVLHACAHHQHSICAHTPAPTHLPLLLRELFAGAPLPLRRCLPLRRLLALLSLQLPAFLRHERLQARTRHRAGHVSSSTPPHPPTTTLTRPTPPCQPCPASPIHPVGAATSALRPPAQPTLRGWARTCRRSFSAASLSLLAAADGTACSSGATLPAGRAATCSCAAAAVGGVPLERASLLAAAAAPLPADAAPPAGRAAAGGCALMGDGVGRRRAGFWLLVKPGRGCMGLAAAAGPAGCSLLGVAALGRRRLRVAPAGGGCPLTSSLPGSAATGAGGTACSERCTAAAGASGAGAAATSACCGGWPAPATACCSAASCCARCLSFFRCWRSSCCCCRFCRAARACWRPAGAARTSRAACMEGNVDRGDDGQGWSPCGHPTPCHGPYCNRSSPAPDLPAVACAGVSIVVSRGSQAWGLSYGT